MFLSFGSSMASRVKFGGLFHIATVTTASIALFSLSRVYADQPIAPGNTFQIDTGFATRIESSDYPITTYVVRASTDGGFFVGGNFSTIGGQLHLGLAKFNANGTLDTAFNNNGGFDGIVDGIELLPNGRLLVAGTFSSLNGTSRPGLARLNADGTLDTSFVPHAGVNKPGIVAVQSDGRILLATRVYTASRIYTSGLGSGATTTAASENATASMGLSRINADGSADPTFVSPSISELQYVTSILPLPNGKLLVGGISFTIGGTTYSFMVRLNADGSVDPSFSLSSSLNLAPTSLALQSDGKIVACGYPPFFVGGPPTPRTIRLNQDGSLDSTFQPPADPGFSPTSLLVLPNGKIFVGGNNNIYVGGGPQPANTFRLNSNGSVDATFTAPSLDGLQVQALALLTSGSIVAGGYSNSLNSSATASLARITASGTLDPLATANSRCPASWFFATPLAGGKILVWGSFNWINDVSRNGIARLNTDGSVDTSFAPGTGFNSLVESSAIQPDGKIVVGGAFSSFNGVPRRSIARLNADGSLDTSFSPDPSQSGIPLALAVQPDGKIIGAGFFTYSSVVRFLPNGTIDPGFATIVSPLGPSTTTYAVALQPDGKMIVGGDFTYGSYPNQHENIARLTSDGFIDPTFDPGAGANSIVDRIILQSDGRVLLGGSFSTYNTTTREYLARVQPEGSIDTTFNPSNAYGYTLTPAIQPNGRLVVGSFTSSSNLARLNTDGTVDNSFTAYDHNGGISSANFLEDGRLLVTGGMTFSTGVKQIGLSLLKSETYSGSSSSSSSSGSSSGSDKPADSSAGAPSLWFLLAAITLLGGALRGDVKARQKTPGPTEKPHV